MREQPQFTTQSEADGVLSLKLTGPLIVALIGPLDSALRALDVPVRRIDLSGVTAIDTAGAWIVLRTAEAWRATITEATEDAGRLIRAMRGAGEIGPLEPPRAPIFIRVPEAVGALILGIGKGSIGILGFMGALLVATWEVMKRPEQFRMTAFVRQMELVGVNALAIIGMMSFLVGIVIAQQGAVQLQQFGAQVYTINLTARLAMRELGILMTAIMVAGRSGSAFAAQIGTMKLTEEIDAMRTIGISPMQALVLPRVLASVVMLPLLGFYAALAAILGGAVISAFTLGIPLLTFLARTRDVVPMTDLYVGLVKGPVFGLIVAVAGCYQGMLVSGNSEEVGLRTTMAVVQAIFMVIVLDAFFAVFFTKVGWI
ncbi:MAG: MlaE family lipid ABC transporter permease subunit [Sphingomonadales bacterium]|nr:MlaE family lipid ABC transporter permease subunit [Sphingomonadales bacterium]